MIRVLKSWLEIGEATQFLRRHGYPEHQSPEKNWDLRRLHALVDPLPRETPILDLGCGELLALDLLARLGFRDLSGIDLRVGPMHRLRQLKRWASGRPRYRLTRGDLLRTPFPPRRFKVAVCLSVIEHGVPIAPFFAETGRILGAGGLLFLTTDYWPEPLDCRPTDPRPFGLPWRVFARRDIEELIEAGRRGGFRPLDGADVPTCQDRCVSWNGCDYSFLCLVLEREAPPG